MSMLIVIGGVILIIYGIAAGIMAAMNFLPPTVYIYATMAVCFIFGLLLAIVGFMSNGVLGPLMSAKSSGNTMLAVLTASGKARIRSGKENNGIVPTKDGSFMVLPGSVFTLPNGVKFGVAYYKHGAVLPPAFIKQCEVMKKNGINDATQVEAVAKRAFEEKKDFTIELD